MNIRKEVDMLLCYPETSQEIYLVEESTGVLWFKAADVCSVLGFSNPSVAISNHCPEDSKVIDYQEGRGRSALFISESGVYLLIMVSKSNVAAGFRQWLAREVLPSLRRTGAYQMKPEDDRRFEAIGLRAKIGKAQESLTDWLVENAAKSQSTDIEAVARSIAELQKIKDESAIENEKRGKDGRSTKQTRSFQPKSLEAKILQVAANRGKPIAARDVQMLSNSNGRPTPEQIKECFYSLAAQGKGEVTTIGDKRIRFSAN